MKKIKLSTALFFAIVAISASIQASAITVSCSLTYGNWSASTNSASEAQRMVDACLSSDFLDEGVSVSQ